MGAPGAVDDRPSLPLDEAYRTPPLPIASATAC